MSKSLLSFVSLCVVGLVIEGAWGQTSTEYETGPDGVQYKVTRRTWQQSLPTTEYQTREERVYSPQQTTDYQSFNQLYAVPVTEYRWVSRMRGWWNPFSRPYWTHHLEPFSRTDYRSATVQMPIARTEWVEQTRTVQVPVTTYRTVTNQSESRVAVSAPVGGTSTLTAQRSVPVVARPVDSGRYGSQKLSNDPPREPSKLLR